MRGIIALVVVVVAPTLADGDNTGVSLKDLPPEIRGWIEEHRDFRHALEAIRDRDSDRQELANYASIADALKAFRAKLERLELTNATLVSDLQVETARAIAVRVDQPTPEQAGPPL